MIRIHLLRHGQVDGPSAMYGRTDVALTDIGWQQLEQATRGLKPDRVISSPLKRCSMFARHYAVQQGIPLDIEDNLQEYDFGEWDGVPFERLFDGDADATMLDGFWRLPAEHTPPGGERLDDMFERVVACWATLVSRCAGEEELVVFCHGGVIRLLLAHLLPVDWREGRWFSQLSIDYGSRSTVELSGHPDALPVVRGIGVLPSV